METVILSPRSNSKQAVANNWVVDHMNSSLATLHARVLATEAKVKEVHEMKLPCELVGKPLVIEIEHPVIKFNDIVEVVKKPVFEIVPHITTISRPIFNIVEAPVTIEKPVYKIVDRIVEVTTLSQKLKVDRILIVCLLILELAQFATHFLK